MDECHYGQAPYSVLGIYQEKWIRPRGSYSVKLSPWKRQITVTVRVDGYHSWHQQLLQPCLKLTFPDFSYPSFPDFHPTSLAIPFRSPVFPFVHPVLFIQVFLRSVSLAHSSLILHAFSRQAYLHQWFQPTPHLKKPWSMFQVQVLIPFWKSHLTFR